MASEEVPPSVSDIIDWQTEQSIDFGNIGWSKNFPEADFFTKNWNVTYADAASSAPRDMLAMMDAELNEKASEQQRVLERMVYMEAHSERVKDAELEVNCRLLQAGKTQQDIESYTAGDEIFRRKVEDLYNLENPPPPRNGVDAYIEYGLADNRRLASIQLEIKGSLAEFLDDRKSHLARNKDMWEPLESIYYDGSPWQYRWRPQDKSIESKEKWFPLETQHDYDVLTKKAAKAATLDNAKFRPVLSQEIKTEYKDPQKEAEDAEDARRNAMLIEFDKKWGVVPPDTNNPDEDGWTDVDLARDIAPGGVLHEWAMARIWKGVATREAQEKEQEMQRSRAMNDRKRIESDTARGAEAPNLRTPTWALRRTRPAINTSTSRRKRFPPSRDDDFTRTRFDGNMQPRQEASEATREGASQLMFIPVKLYPHAVAVRLDQVFNPHRPSAQRYSHQVPIE
ncbi:MAG: hypothetical protein Q9184_000811 [Pyrenodesmia sp. 2 TL-2023]